MEQASTLLKEGNVYSRRKLMEIFKTKDETLKRNGIYQPKDSNGNPMGSVLLLFNQTSKRQHPSYKNLILGNSVIWTGQKEGMRDKLIIDHQLDEKELLVFYRKNNKEYEDLGYKYYGQYKYVMHQGQKPARFILERVHKLDLNQLGLVIPPDGIQRIFNKLSNSNTDIDEYLEIEKVLTYRRYRKEQKQFSEAVKNYDNNACTVSENTYVGNLEVGHIRDVRFNGSFTIDNGLTFTSNIHLAIDRGHALINPSTFEFELNYKFPQSSEIPQFAGKIISAAKRIDPAHLEFKYIKAKNGELSGFSV